MRRQIEALRRSGTTVVIVDHVLDELFQIADRVVAFDFGTPTPKARRARSCANRRPAGEVTIWRTGR